MTTAKTKAVFTPGPWAWDSRNGKSYLVTVSPEAEHAIVAGWPCGIEERDGRIPDDETGCADARLIAAAPELYDLARGVADLSILVNYPDRERDLILLARKLLAKIDGDAR